ncbi:MAG: hypothetical protein NC040_08120 [Muribaculaceae bacterium]|nr:hypothetical protein [Alistipes senegalensis]MCM1474011.1 hypothetical protein [Muribaculaceae bacterium]
MDNKEKFTPEELKTINKYSWLSALFNLVNGIILCYVNNTRIKVGTYHLYLVTMLFVVSTFLIVYITMLYFRKLKKIKNHRKRYNVLTILCIILFVLHAYICTGYTADIFTGEKTIITSEYSTLWGYFHTEIDGEEIRLDIPDETIKKLRENDYIDGEEIYNFNTNTYYYKKKAHVTYYPHSKVLKNAFIEE